MCPGQTNPLITPVIMTTMEKATFLIEFSVVDKIVAAKVAIIEGSVLVAHKLLKKMDNRQIYAGWCQ